LQPVKKKKNKKKGGNAAGETSSVKSPDARLPPPLMNGDITSPVMNGHAEPGEILYQYYKV